MATTPELRSEAGSFKSFKDIEKSKKHEKDKHEKDKHEKDTYEKEKNGKEKNESERHEKEKHEKNDKEKHEKERHEKVKHEKDKHEKKKNEKEKVDKEKVEKEKREKEKEKSSKMWNSAPTRTRGTTNPESHKNFHTSDSTSSEQDLPFDANVVMQMLAKMDVLMDKKEKNMFDSIKGGVKDNFYEQMINIIDELEYHKSKAPGGTWASLFHQKAQKSKDVTPLHKLQHYQQLLSSFLHTLQKKEKKLGSIITEIMKGAESFSDFLQTHLADPDSCLIGLPCAEEVLKNVMCEMEDQKQVCNMIVEWSVEKDDAGMKEQIQNVCTMLRRVDKLEKGDLAIIARRPEDESSKTMVFGRYTGEKKQNSNLLEFFVNPEETKTEWILRRDVYPVSTNLKETIKTTANLSKVVQDPAQNFIKVLKENVATHTDEYLVGNGLDQEVIVKGKRPKRKRNKTKRKRNKTKRKEKMEKNFEMNGTTVRKGTVEMKDLPALRDALPIVRKFHAEPPEHFYKEMAFYARALVSIHVRKMANSFFLSREESITAMRNFAATPWAPSIIRTTLVQFQSVYDNLSVSSKELSFNSKKKMYENWWLKRIEYGVHSFLVKNKFSMRAVPINYSIEPPKNMQAVQENLEMLETILHAEPESNFNPTPIVETITNDIYPVVDEFIKDLKAIICSALKLDNSDDSIESLEESFTNAKDKDWFSHQNAENLKAQINELKYFENMKSDRTKSGDAIANIEPIGKLVRNQFIRYRNEHRTVLELWGNLKEEKLTNGAQCQKEKPMVNFKKELAKELLDKAFNKLEQEKICEAKCCLEISAEFDSSEEHANLRRELQMQVEEKEKMTELELQTNVEVKREAIQMDIADAEKQVKLVKTEEEKQMIEQQLEVLRKRDEVLREHIHAYEERQKELQEREARLEQREQLINEQTKRLEQLLADLAISTGDISAIQQQIQVVLAGDKDVDSARKRFSRMQRAAKDAQQNLILEERRQRERVEWLQKQMELYRVKGMSPAQLSFRNFLKDVKRLSFVRHQLEHTPFPLRCFISYAWEKDPLVNKELQKRP